MMTQVTLRMRMSSADAHYAGQLVSGAKMLELFGDAATELLIRHDGDEGLFRAYESIEFLAPVRAGDFVEVTARIVKVGNSSRTMEFVAKKYIEAKPTAEQPHAAVVLAEPIVCTKAVGTCVYLKPGSHP